MTRILSFIIAVCLCFLLCGCDNSNKQTLNSYSESSVVSPLESVIDKTNKTTNSKATSSSATSSNAKTDANHTPASSSIDRTPTDYKTLSCREYADIPEWQNIRLSFSGAPGSIELSIPLDWSLNSSVKGEYSIKRGGKIIGSISARDFANPEDFYEFDIVSDTFCGSEFFRCTQISQYYEDKKEVFYRIYKFMYGLEEDGVVAYLRVNLKEFGNTAALHLLDSAKPITTPEFTPLKNVNNGKEILILGNSFIGSSQIGDFLNDMLSSSNVGYTATAYSRGYANVGTYAQDTNLCNQIRNGKYSYVFQCGFYSQSAVEDFQTMKNVCAASGTPIVIFPAHNEQQSWLNVTMKNNQDIPVLDWKGEIDMLIDSGVDFWDFCINDSHKHSTPLAGYVGAHMIYSVLFGKIPPKLSCSPMSMDEINSLLGNYSNKGGRYAPLSGKEYILK